MSAMRLTLLVCALIASGCKRGANEVVVYASQDQVYAEPILQQFSQTSGIKVRAVYDSEAVKTVGLVNRLLAEKSNPQCDVFWNNEALRTHQLDRHGIVERMASFGYRSRCLVINTNLVSPRKGLPSLSALTNSEWRGRVALAYPLFGSTATHFVALRRKWGTERWEAWCRALHRNKPLLVDGNSVVVKFVGRGEAWIGLTDFDDIIAGQRDGLPVVAAALTEDSLFIPNTAAIIRGTRRPVPAEKLLEYLQTPPVVERLIAVGALEGAVVPATTTIDWPDLVAELQIAMPVLREIFVRE